MNKEKKRILIIDDEATIRSLLKISLQNQGYETAEADTGISGLEKAANFHPHLVILDLGLPEMGGYEVLKTLRQWTSIPILILTVYDDEVTKVALLDAGADDYLTKPFGTPELLARVRVSLRHYNELEATPVFRSNSLEIDLSKKTVFLAGEPIKLTLTEYALLSILVRNTGKVVPQSQLLHGVWGKNALDQTHYLRIYIAQLRKKLEVDPANPQHIITDPGVGYRII